jgi:uncharacterized sporulation protein YeaH/YhbH (DUF444 family)
MAPYIEERDELLEELMELEGQLEELQAGGTSSGSDLDGMINDRINAIIARLEELATKFLHLDGFDKSDLRYRKKEAKPLKTVDAVLFMIMDISGSMDESKKTIARRWFALLYAFVKRRYTSTELVFIAHHNDAIEMSEDDFFTTRINGGTSVSPALKLVNKIIKERYDPNETNIIVCHASDGDNWDDDNTDVINELTGEGNLMGKIQFFSYVEVGKGGGQMWFNIGNGTSGAKTDTNLWQTYDKARDNYKEKGKIILSIIETADDCYPVFKKVFKKASK